MKVAVSFPGCHRRAGVERVVQECSLFLAERGHDVTVFANDWEEVPNGKLSYEKVDSLKHPTFLRGLSYYYNASRQLKNSDFDVLNVHGCVCPTGGVHWTQSLHIAWLERAKQFRKFMSPAWLKQRLNPLHPILLSLEKHHFRNRNYQHVIVTTEQVQADLEQFYGVPASDVTVIPNGFAPAEFNPEVCQARRTEARAEIGLSHDQIALLFVANELDRKGYNTILGALAILNDDRLKLLVVGRASMNEVRRRAEQHGLSKQIIVCGATSDVAQYHAAADLFILPTQYEAFCLAILEALGSGLPVLTSNVPGAADAILPGINGLLVQDPLNAEELASNIERLLDDSFRKQCSKVAPSTVEKYQWPRVFEAYERILKHFAKCV